MRNEHDGMIGVGPCFMCGRPFPFHPDLVPSIPIDPVTDLPPDLGGDPERAVRQPICEQCLDYANEQRVGAGLDPWIVKPGAYL